MKKQIYYSNGTRKGIYDDDYVFFDDGTIEHHYDKHATDCNRIDEITADKIPSDRIKSIIEECPEEIKDTITNILTIK